MEKTELKELLRESTEKALFELGKILDKDSTLYNELIILWKRHDEVERKIRLAIIGHQEAGIENNQITDGLLKLIDRIPILDEAIFSDINEKKEILIEEAIEWLSNALIENRLDYERLYPSGKLIVDYSIEAADISKDGTFSIKTDTVIHTIGDSKKMDNINAMYNIEGSFQDIGNTVIEENNEISKDCIYELKCRATNNKKVFKRIPLHKVSYRPKEDIEEDINHTFSILLKDYEFALKVKNAIDYLAIYFGRKEDAF